MGTLFSLKGRGRFDREICRGEIGKKGGRGMQLGRYVN